MKYIKVYEVHPGAKTPSETVSLAIASLLQSKIDKETIEQALRLFIKYLKSGWTDEFPEVRINSDMAEALIKLERCELTLREDGFPESWIADELKRALKQLGLK